MKLRPLLLFPLLWGCAADLTVPPAPAPHVTAVFDPLATPPQIPLPNDLAKTGGDGVHLNVPDGPTDSPAQLDFNHYLNTLDGFPSSTPGSFSFGGPIDAGTLTVGTPTMNGSVLIFDATGMLPLGPTDYNLSLAPDRQHVIITPTRRWASGSQFVVLIFGGSDPAGVRGASGETVLASPAFFFLRSPRPVLGICGDGDTPDCACPPAVVAAGDPNDETCHSVITGLSNEQARQLEGGRQQLSAVIDAILPFAGTDGNEPRSRNNIVLMWNFTIASAPMAVFDPVRGQVPFPNDALIDQTTMLVNLPIVAGDPQAAIKMGLNTLDGFSTTAPEVLGIDSAADIDGTTVVAGKTAVIIPVTASTNPQYTAGPVLVNNGMTFAGEIALTPTTALDSEQTRYGVLVTSDVKDKQGRNLVAPPTIVLSRGKNPLVDAEGHSTVPTVLGDAEAQQLEVLRQALAPLYDLVETTFMVPREQVAALWTFSTQSIIRPLNALDELPTKAALSTSVSIAHIADSAEIAAKAAMLPYPTSHLGGIVIGTMTTRRVVDPTTSTINFNRNSLDNGARFTVKEPAVVIDEPVRFVLNLPNSSGPWPVAIVQHGITTWRGTMMPVADAFAAAGWATIMFDLPFHGARSACTDDAQCVAGTAGACNKMTGVCAGGLKLATVSATDPLACALQPISGDAADCRPLASGAALINPGNLFASRDNLRQYVVDAAQLVRVLQDAGSATGLLQQLGPAGLTYDPGRLSFLGMSLGGMVGSLFLSVAPQPTVAVFNVTGGHIIDIIATGSLSSLLQPLLSALMVQPDTAAFFDLANTARWILDPADPFAVGSHLVRDPAVSYLINFRNGPKTVIVQEAGMDTVILPQFQAAFALEVFGPTGLDESGHAQGHTNSGTAVSTFFATAQHGSLIAPVPSLAVTQSEQTQAVTWISSAGATLPSP